MDLPAKARIGAMDYEIQSWHPKEANLRARFGEALRDDCIIRIDESYGTRRTAMTLMHEVMHVIFLEYGISDVDDEERTVTGIARGLSQVWRDNPEIAAFWAAHLR